MHTSKIIYTLYLHAITQLIISIAINEIMVYSVNHYLKLVIKGTDSIHPPPKLITIKSVVSIIIIIIIMLMHVSYVRYTLRKMQHFGGPVN